MNRPIFIILIGYIIGILWGLYLKISIVFFYIFLLILYYISNISKFKKKKFFHYIKILIKFNVLLLIIISSLISNIIIKFQTKKYQNLYHDGEELKIQVQIIDNKKEKQYYNRYKIKVLSSKYKNTYLYMTTKKNLEYGEILEIQGNFSEPSEARNYKGFNYKEYLKTLKIYGTIRVELVKKIDIHKGILYYTNKLHLKIKDNLEKTYNSSSMPIVLGVLLGDTSEIDEETREDFSQSSISHVLAVSGLHVSYIIYLSEKSTQGILGQRKSRIIEILILFIYMAITGFSISVIRSVIMATLMCTAFLVYRKSDTLNNISISAIVILFMNPYNLFSTSFQFTYAGTIGVVFFRTIVEDFIMNIKIKSPCLKEKYTNFCIKHNSFVEEIAVAISAQFMTMPIIITKYNFISLSFIVTNILVGIIIGPLVIGGIIQILVTFLSLKIGTEIAKVVQIPITALSLISKIGTKFPITNFNVITPDTWQIIIYYFIIYIIYYRHKIKKIQKYSFNQKIILKISKYVYSKRKKIIRVFIIILISSIIIKKIPGDLKIYFVDVGQGDCCLIETPKHQKILIDGGGQKNFDIGKNTLLPYLFNRKILEIDYCIISHFDQDHCGGILYILEQTKVKNVIIGKQYEDSTNYNKFKEIVKKQNLNVKIVEAGMRINIEKNLYFDVLWPDSQKMISDNAINNNSLVCKLNYNKFSMLFTGDIEEIAEKEIVSKYENNTSILKSTILKTAHHGSKTSSIEKILDVVKPQYAFIGVGENNTFGHPSNITIENLEKRKIKIYRTDKMGEICIKITKKAIIKINTKLNTS